MSAGFAQYNLIFFFLICRLFSVVPFYINRLVTLSRKRYTRFTLSLEVGNAAKTIDSRATNEERKKKENNRTREACARQ